MGKVVAVIGASADRSKFGNKAVRAFMSAGYEVFPINPHEHEIEGQRVYASVLDVPKDVDMATVYVPAEAGLHVISELARKKVGEVWLNPGADEDEVIDEARRQGLKVIVACSIVGIGKSPRDF